MEGERVRCRRAPARWWCVAVAGVVVLATAVACRSDDSAARTRARIVVSTAMLADAVRAVVGPDADVEVIVDPPALPTTYTPTPQDEAVIAGADLLVTNGLSEESAALRATLDEATKRGVATLEVGPKLSPRKLGPDGTGLPDPHVWLDPDRMTRVAKLVADAAAPLPGGNAATYQRRAEDYAKVLAKADEDVQAALLPVPAEVRTIVADDDAVGYFADRFGIVVIDTGEDPSVAATMDETGTRVMLATADQASDRFRGIADEVRARGGDATVVTVPVRTFGPAGSATGSVAGLLTTLAQDLAGAFRT